MREHSRAIQSTTLLEYFPLSICLSYANVVLKRLNRSARKQRYMIALGLWCQASWWNSNTRSPNKSEVEKNRRFLTNISLYLGNGTRQERGYWRRLIGSHSLCDLRNGTIFNDLEWLLLATLNDLIMVALCNMADHMYFHPVSFFFFFLSFFPRLISAVGDWMSAILPHMVWP